MDLSGRLLVRLLVQMGARHIDFVVQDWRLRRRVTQGLCCRVEEGSLMPLGVVRVDYGVSCIVLCVYLSDSVRSQGRSRPDVRDEAWCFRSMSRFGGHVVLTVSRVIGERDKGCIVVWSDSDTFSLVYGASGVGRDLPRQMKCLANSFLVFSQYIPHLALIYTLVTASFWVWTCAGTRSQLFSTHLVQYLWLNQDVHNTSCRNQGFY